MLVVPWHLKITEERNYKILHCRFFSFFFSSTSSSSPDLFQFVSPPVSLGILLPPSLHFSAPLFIVFLHSCFAFCSLHPSLFLFFPLLPCFSPASLSPLSPLSCNPLPSSHTKHTLTSANLPDSPAGQLCFSVLIGVVFLLFHGSINKLFYICEVGGAAGLDQQEKLQNTNITVCMKLKVDLQHTERLPRCLLWRQTLF